MFTKSNRTGSPEKSPGTFHLRREQEGLHDQVWGVRINALVFWIVLFHTSLFVPPVVAWTLLFMGYSSLLALLTALVSIGLSLVVSLIWARYSYRKQTRWTATLHRRGAETSSYRVVSTPTAPAGNPSTLRRPGTEGEGDHKRHRTPG